MKTLTKTLFATLLTTILSISTVITSSAAYNYKNFDTPIRGINKIWVSGNVKIILTQSNVEAVSIGDQFNRETTSIQTKGQTLYINSSESHQVTINVSVKDLQRIEAAGSSTVVTTGNFDVKYLQIFLTQCATAKVKATTKSLYTVITENAVLKMSGTADEHILVADNIRSAKLRNFISLRTESRVSGALAIKKYNLKAELIK